MNNRIICPFHAEATPSLVQYQDGWRCFGSCGRTYMNDEVEKATGLKCGTPEPTEKEDIEETLEYIHSLPMVKIRGLQFHSDNKGFYIVWPDKNYYKHRRFGDVKPKYVGAKGHKVPLFIAWPMGSVLAVVEGELNALSVSVAFPEWAVCSPGSASQFSEDHLKNHLPFFKSFSEVVVVLDDDPAGSKALIETRAFLLYKAPFVRYIKMSTDANEVLVSYGKEELRKRLLG